MIALAPMALSTFDGSDASDEWMMVESSDESDEDEGNAFSPPIPSAGSTVVAFDVMKYVTSWVWKAYQVAVMRA